MKGQIFYLFIMIWQFIDIHSPFVLIKNSIISQTFKVKVFNSLTLRLQYSNVPSHFIQIHVDLKLFKIKYIKKNSMFPILERI